MTNLEWKSDDKDENLIQCIIDNADKWDEVQKLLKKADECDGCLIINPDYTWDIILFYKNINAKTIESGKLK